MKQTIPWVVATLFLFSTIAAADSPPYDSVTISGKTDKRYTKVSLFESGSAVYPKKTSYVSTYDGKYSITVKIPGNMKPHDDYYMTDLRFWGDTNKNGKKDQGEPVSACHFIIWKPDRGKIYMKVYEGATYPITSHQLHYDY